MNNINELKIKIELKSENWFFYMLINMGFKITRVAKLSGKPEK